MDMFKKIAQGSTWLLIASITSRILTTLTTIILARILFPTDFGLYAIGLLVINTISIFSSLGFGEAIVFKKDDIKIAADTSFVSLVSFYSILFVLTNLAAPYIAIFFNNTLIKPIVRLLSVLLITNAIKYVPSHLLEKELEFKKKVLPETLPHGFFSIVSISLALRGHGIYSLVYGQIAFALSQMILILMVSPWRPSFRFDKNIALELISYGKHVMGFTLFWFIFTNLDQAVVGKLLSSENLGYYTLAFTIGNLPVTLVTLVISRIAFPAFSKLRDDSKMLKLTYLRALRYVAMSTIPAIFGIFLISHDFVTIILGEKWAPSIPLIKMFCVYALLRSLAGVGGMVFLGTGAPQTLKKIFFKGAVMSVLLVPLLTLRMGLFGTALAVVITMVFISAAHFYYSLPILNINFKEVMETLLPFLIASFMMIIPIMLLKLTLNGTTLLIGEVLAGAITYLILLNFLMNKETKGEIIRIVYANR